MDIKLNKVKLVFENVKDMRSEIINLFENLDHRISKLKELYADFVNNAKHINTPDVNPFIFSLDSLFFQTSLIEKEYNYLNDYKNTIINRMYGEYYKLFKLILVYIDKSNIDSKLTELLKNKKYPRYDDLDNEKEYDFNLIIHINDDIIGVVNNLINNLNEKQKTLKQYIVNQNYGLNVNNFVSTCRYEVNILQEKIDLYENYLDFFYHIHQKLTRQLINKINILENQINTDIQFEGGILSKTKNNAEKFTNMNMNLLGSEITKYNEDYITGQVINQEQEPDEEQKLEEELEQDEDEEQYEEQEHDEDEEQYEEQKQKLDEEQYEEQEQDEEQDEEQYEEQDEEQEQDEAQEQDEDEEQNEEQDSNICSCQLDGIFNNEGETEENNEGNEIIVVISEKTESKILTPNQKKNMKKRLKKQEKRQHTRQEQEQEHLLMCNEDETEVVA